MAPNRSQKYKIAVINGPNLNFLGKREPHIYGKLSLENINYSLTQEFGETHQLFFFQSNSEGELINFLQQCANFNGIVINPAAYSHTSIAIRDAIASLLPHTPSVEVHLSNIFAREGYRKSAITAEACVGQICGFGAQVYELGILALSQHIKSRKPCPQ